MKYTISVEKNFSSAHALRGYQGKCERLHGHNWKVRVVLEGVRLNQLGMLIDFTDAKRILSECIEQLDHRVLNEVPPFKRQLNPSAENIAAYLFATMKKALKKEGHRTVRLGAIHVQESDHSWATVTNR